MTDPRPIVLLRFGEPIQPTRHLVGDYSLWFQRAIPDEVLGVVDLRDPAEDLPEERAAAIIMGSPLAVFEPHPWMPRALEAARALLADPRPVLGVCFGHQLFAAAAGGEVGRNARVEVGTVEVHLDPAARDDPLLGGLPGTLRVNASHDDTVTRLPDDAPQVLGRSERDRHHVLRWGERAWSVQFHPEMRAPETRLSVDWRRDRLAAEGEDPAAVRAAVGDAPHGQELLRRFVDLVRGR